MNIERYNNSRTFFFMSGMFAGGWIWRETYPKIPNSVHWLMHDSLCEVGESINSITDKVVQEVSRLKSPVTLVGNSLGSYICLDVARSVPERVKRVVISGSAGFGQVNLPIKLNRHDPEGVAKKLVDIILYDKSNIPEEAVQRTAVSFKSGFKNIVKLIRESNTLQAGKLIREVKCPVHAIWGSHDVVTPYEQAREVFEHFGVTTDVIDCCGHSPMYERPDEFSQLVNYYVD